jgi:hypothetical protein
MSVDTWCDVCFHQWLSCSWFIPKEEEEEEEKGNQVSSVHPIPLGPMVMQQNGHN